MPAGFAVNLLSPMNKNSSTSIALAEAENRVGKLYAIPDGNGNKKISPGKRQSSSALESPRNRNSKKDIDRNEAKINHQAVKLTKTIGYQSNKVSNKYLRGIKAERTKGAAKNAETQTDPIRIGDIQLDVSDTESDGIFGLHNVQMDKGTDAPKFVILNVIPGRPDSALKTRAGRFKKEITTRIGHKVAEMM